MSPRNKEVSNPAADTGRHLSRSPEEAVLAALEFSLYRAVQQLAGNDPLLDGPEIAYCVAERLALSHAR